MLIVTRTFLFQFTPLREGRLAVNVLNAWLTISIHAPPRGATRRTNSKRKPARFQFTPLREGRRKRARGRKTAEGFQFTPLREGRHRKRCWTYRRTISIHAPPRGATYWESKSNRIYFISIHAPPRGATLPSKRISASQYDFNSRPSARGDARVLPSLALYVLFQFTPLREGRQKCWMRRCGGTIFQFTPLREGRRSPAAYSAVIQ